MRRLERLVKIMKDLRQIPTDSDMQKLAATIVQRLVAPKHGAGPHTLAAAESLTGGMLSAVLVGVPGVSEVYRGGVTVYATDLMISILSIAKAGLRRHGPVDPSVAVQMAQNVSALCNADWGVSTTGVAGPDPQGEKPVGRTYVAVTFGGISMGIYEFNLTGNCETIRRKATMCALMLLEKCTKTLEN